MLRRLFAENTWGELTHIVKARIVLELTDLWLRGKLKPAPPTLERSKILFAYINERFKKLDAAKATPARAGI